MKVLIADKFESIGIDELDKLGVEIEYQPDLKGKLLQEKIISSHANVLIVRSTQVTAAMMQSDDLRLIIRAGAGYNTIDVDAAHQKKIAVANCPGKNSRAVAELTIGLIIAIDRKIPDNVSSFREGLWNKKAFSQAKGLSGLTIGLVGFGQITQELIPRLKAFGLKPLIFSKWLTSLEAQSLGVEKAINLQELALKSDIVSIHVSLRPETRKIIDQKFISSMKSGSYLINTSRAEVIDQSALEKACNAGEIFAALDVFEEEPATAIGTYEGSLKDCKNIYCTHHIGASTEQAQEAIAYEVVKIIRHYMQNGNVLNLVNINKSVKANG